MIIDDAVEITTGKLSKLDFNLLDHLESTEKIRNMHASKTIGEKIAV